MLLANPARLQRPLLGLAALALAALPLSAGGADGLTDRESFASDGSQATQHCTRASLSDDGRYLVFETGAALVPADTNGLTDVYLVDRDTGDVVPVSVTLAGTFGNGSSREAEISADGTTVAFSTLATDLVGFDANGALDVLVKDLATGQLRRASEAAGSFVPAWGASGAPSLSADGRFVAFHSLAGDLVAGDANGTWDVFVHDMLLDTVSRASLGVFAEADGASMFPSISADGSRVAFQSEATNLILLDGNGESDVFVRRFDVGTTLLASRPFVPGTANGGSWGPSISNDGTRILFTSGASDIAPGDVNGVLDAFLFDSATDTVSLVSHPTSGSSANGPSVTGGISGDGRYASFVSLATNLTDEASPYEDVYVADLDGAGTWIASRRSGVLNLANDDSSNPVLSGDGSVVAFESWATNLDQADTNGLMDVFTRTIFAEPVAYCAGTTTSAGCTPSIGSTGTPSAGSDSGFEITLTDVPNQKAGILFYGTSGRAEVPFLGGTLCVAGPRRRTPMQQSGGSVAGSDCTGSYGLDMNAFAQGLAGGNPAAALALVGQTVNAQYWGRDPLGVVTTFLSDALEYVVGL